MYDSDGTFSGVDKKGKLIQEQPGEYHVIHIHVPVSPSVVRHKGRIFDRNDDGDMDITDMSDRVFQCYARKQSTYYVNKVYPHWKASDLREDLIRSFSLWEKDEKTIRAERIRKFRRIIFPN